MAPPADPRRSDLIVPYKARVGVYEESNVMLLASIICMAALFLRKRLLAWTGFVLTASAFMSDNGARSASSQSPLSMLFMSVAALLSSYLPLLMNPPDKR